MGGEQEACSMCQPVPLACSSWDDMCLSLPAGSTSCPGDGRRSSSRGTSALALPCAWLLLAALHGHIAAGHICSGRDPKYLFRPASVSGGHPLLQRLCTLRGGAPQETRDVLTGDLALVQCQHAVYFAPMTVSLQSACFMIAV